MDFNSASNIQDKEQLLKALLDVAKSNNMFIARPEVFKSHPALICRVFSYLSQSQMQSLQLLSTKFYRTLIPKIMGRQPSVKKWDANGYLFSRKEKMFSAISISHIALIDSRRVLVSSDGMKTEIYTFTPEQALPHREVWKLCHELEPARKMRVQVSGVGRELFILSSDDFRLQFYLKGERSRLMHQEKIDPHECLAVCITKDQSLALMGHHGGIFTMWTIGNA